MNQTQKRAVDLVRLEKLVRMVLEGWQNKLNGAAQAALSQHDEVSLQKALMLLLTLMIDGSPDAVRLASSDTLLFSPSTYDGEDIATILRGLMLQAPGPRPEPPEPKTFAELFVTVGQMAQGCMVRESLEVRCGVEVLREDKMLARVFPEGRHLDQGDIPGATEPLGATGWTVVVPNGCAACKVHTFNYQSWSEVCDQLRK